MSNVSSPSKQPSRTAIEHLFDTVADIKVPHNYFTHFYILSVACSVFWGWTLWASNGLNPEAPLRSASAATVGLTQLLMLAQGVRRLLESYTYTSGSKSGMWFGHWILGMMFYFTTNIAVWIEGAASFENHIPQYWLLSEDASHRLEGNIGWKWTFLIPAILTAQALQHSYHAYLYRLRTENSTYQLPSHPIFPNLLCPHYTCEVAVYLLLSFLAAPPGRILNWTLFSATVLVLVNLGVTANGTKEWYLEKFGAGKVEKRTRMIPWIW